MWHDEELTDEELEEYRGKEIGEDGMPTEDELMEAFKMEPVEGPLFELLPPDEDSEDLEKYYRRVHSDETTPTQLTAEEMKEHIGLDDLDD